MNSINARKYHKCRNGCDIWCGMTYYPQRRGKALCFKCGYKRKKNKTFLTKLFKWLGNHGE